MTFHLFLLKSIYLQNFLLTEKNLNSWWKTSYFVEKTIDTVQKMGRMYCTPHMILRLEANWGEIWSSQKNLRSWNEKISQNKTNFYPVRNESFPTFPFWWSAIQKPSQSKPIPCVKTNLLFPLCKKMNCIAHMNIENVSFFLQASVTTTLTAILKMVRYAMCHFLFCSSLSSNVKWHAHASLYKYDVLQWMFLRCLQLCFVVKIIFQDFCCWLDLTDACNIISKIEK